MIKSIGVGSTGYEANPYKIQERLIGSIWGITTFFNSQRYTNKLANYRKFRKMSQKQGLRLITVELAFGNRAFELFSQDSDLLVQVRSNAVIWHKERLLNIGLMNLPLDCDKVIWVDADTIFDNDNWVEETARLLEEYVVVQAFSQCGFLTEKDTQSFLTSENREVLASKYLNRLSPGFPFYLNHYGGFIDGEKVSKIAMPGLAWGARRKFLDKTLFYDKCILGGADWLDAISFYRFQKNAIGAFINTPVLQGLCLEMESRSKAIFDLVQESVYFVNGTIFHLFHGNIQNRLYNARYNFFGEAFDWNKEIIINSYNCWDWRDTKSPVKKSIERYFLLRNEENQWLKQLLFYLYLHRYLLSQFVLKFPKLRILLKPLIKLYKIFEYIFKKSRHIQ